MWKSEEDFPRGGGRSEKIKKSGEGAPTDHTLPTVKKDASVIPKKTQKRKLDANEKIRTQTSSKRVKSQKQHVIVDTPLLQCLTSEMCILGCVRESYEYTVSVSLPGSRIASLPITEISPAYTQQLKMLAQATETDLAEELRSVDDMFHPGMMIPVVVNTIEVDKQRGKTKVKLSCVPSVVNSSLPLSAVTDGMLLFGSVSSVEDHGYRIDLGIKHLQAFLTTKDAESFVETCSKGSQLSIGQPLWCVMKMKGKSGLKAGETRVVNVSVDPDLVQKAMLEETTVLDSVLPGMKVKATIEQKAETGLIVKVHNFEAVIHASQLPKSPLTYKKNAEIDARVLYTHPVTKCLQLTALPKFVAYDGRPVDFFHDSKIGNIMEAKIVRTEKIGVYFSLPSGVGAFAALSKLTDKTEKPDIKNYSIGQSHQCRILGFNYMEGSALVTLKESIISQKFLTVQDISVGDVVEAVVKEVSLTGVAVMLSKGIYSYIHCIHLADVPIKHPEKKFETGMKLKCRVLKVDYQKSKVTLTHKKSLVKTKNPIISDYSKIQPYMVLDGFIIAVKDRVVIVSFFGGVTGFVVAKDMSTEQVDDPSTLFYVGQVIRCRVVYFDKEQKKLKLSFNFGSHKIQEDSSENHFELGKVISAEIIREEKDGFRLSLHSGKETAFLPFSHLSDFQEVQELKKLALKPKQHISEVIYFNKKRQNLMTMKECFIQAAQQNELSDDFTELNCGQLLPAVIKNHEDYGMFLELASGHTGLCPAKTLTYLQPANLRELFKPGQSVITRLAKIDSEKKRFLGSLRVDECYEGGLESPMALLRNYLSSREEALDLLYAEHDELSCYSEVKLGEIVQVTVSSVVKKGILGELSSGAKALATKHHFGSIVGLKTGDKREAVVLFVDPLTPCVELTLDPKVIKAVKHKKDNLKTQLKADQVLKADVLLVKPEFLLMMLRGHGAGKMVYVPTRKHMNDVEVNPIYKVGSYTEVVIKECFGDRQTGILLMHDPAAKAKKEETMSKGKQIKHRTKPGTMMEAKIRTVHPLQLNIAVGNLHGRVHISEAAECLEEGKNPLHSFHPEQTIQVQVIGLRDSRSQSYLPLSNSKASRTLLECTLKESKLECDVEKLLVQHIDLEVGDPMWVFVIKVDKHKVWVQLGLTQQGYIDSFHLTDDMTIANNAANYFSPGQALYVTVLNKDSPDKIVFSLIGSEKDVTVGQQVTAQISSIKDGKCLYVKMHSGRQGVVSSKPSVLHAVGQYIRCQIDKIDGDVITLSLLDESKLPVIQRKRRRRNASLGENTDEIENVPEKKTKKEKRQNKKKNKKKNDEQPDSGVEVNPSSSEAEDESTSNVTKAASTAATEMTRLSLPGFSWDGQLQDLKSKETLPEDDDDDDNDNVAPQSIKSKKHKKRDEEKLIQEHEKKQLSGDLTPETAADFERLVLQSPSSSMVWLRYMAYHAELGEFEKARAVAEKALSSISFREEQEKQNVWLAYLNMETLYGEIKDVKKLLERAVQYNDPLNIFLKQCDMYMNAGKAEDAEQLFIVMTRKYKKEKSVWKAYAQFLYKAGRIQSARNLLQRSITVLEKKDHVEVISRFATLEFSNGDAERGRTMFENLIASYSNRTDLWSVYVDMVTKVGDIAGARLILDRSVKQKFNNKKLAFLLQKFVRFEETHGTEDQIQRVRDMAVELIDT